MFIRKMLPTIIAFVCGTAVTIAYFFNSKPLQSLAQDIMQWRSVIAIFTLGLGAVNIIMVHMRNLRRDGLKNIYSLAMLAMFCTTILVGLGWGQSSKGYRFIFDYINVPTGSAIFSLLAFYIGTAAYRAFRVKNIEAAILLVTGCIVMLGRVPLGVQILPIAPKITDWIMVVLNVGGQRGVMVAGAVGFIAVSLRIIAGLERRVYGVE